MDRDVQLSEPAARLLDVASSVTGEWMRRTMLSAAASGGVDVSGMTAGLDAVVRTESARLLTALKDLLVTDVDEQRTNPLSLFRSAVAGPTAWLRSVGVPAPPSDRFTAERFPDDVYRLGPATWADVDRRLHEPGLIWGAWKAMTVLQRRRDEGLR